MTKRSDLTEFQQKKVFGQALFWSREALATRPAHRAVAEAAIDEIYALAGFRAPAKKRWTRLDHCRRNSRAVRWRMRRRRRDASLRCE